MAGPARGPAEDLVWTVRQACDYFTASGIPCTADQLETIISKLPGFPRAGREPSGPRGGQGKTLYPVSQLMRLHSRVAEWL